MKLHQLPAALAALAVGLIAATTAQAQDIRVLQAKSLHE